MLIGIVSVGQEVSHHKDKLPILFDENFLVIYKKFLLFVEYFLTSNENLEIFWNRWKADYVELILGNTHI